MIAHLLTWLRGPRDGSWPLQDPSTAYDAWWHERQASKIIEGEQR